MYYLLRYYNKQAQLVGLFLKKGVLEFVVKILDKYTYKEFLKIPRFFLKILITTITTIVSKGRNHVQSNYFHV